MRPFGQKKVSISIVSQSRVLVGSSMRDICSSWWGDSSIEMLLVCKFMVGRLQYRDAVGIQVHGGGTPV